MLNQKGQAFSVFELMIAAVVAFAILIVLFMVLNQIGTPTGQDAKNVVANAIKSISPSGDVSTTEFELGGSGSNSVSSSDLTDKTGLDEKSMFFAIGQFGGSSSAGAVSVASDGSALLYNGTTKIRVKARVVCKQTGTALDSYISSSGLQSKYPSGFEKSGSDYCGEDNQPCCVVILIKPTR